DVRADREQGGDLGRGEDDGDVAGAAGADGVEVAEVDLQDVPIQEQDGREGLVLGAGGDTTVDGEVGEEGFDVGVRQVFGMAPAVGGAVEADELLDPVEVGPFGAEGQVLDADL